jgi:hypothetical protein
MADELEELCRRMRLSEHEKQHIRVSKDRVFKSHQEAKFSILFKLLTTRTFNGNAFKNSVGTMWASYGVLSVTTIDDNLFMAAFPSEAVLRRVFSTSPWTFDKKLILMARFVGDLQPTAVKFTHTAFWIRLVNLPIKSMTREMGEDIGKRVGRLIAVDAPEDNGVAWGRYLRIRVEVEIARPLMRGCIIQVEETEPVWVDFRYEHLPIFCYRCGILGHSGSDCFTGARTSAFDRDQYGAWLRALPERNTQGSRRHKDGGMDLNSGSSHGNVSEQGEEPEHGPTHQLARDYEATPHANCGNQIPQNTETDSVFVEDMGLENGTTKTPLFRDCQELPSPGSTTSPGKNTEETLTESPTLAVNLPMTAPRKSMQENWEQVEDVLGRETQCEPCDVEEDKTDNMDSFMGKEPGLSNEGLMGRIWSLPTLLKKTTWKKKARSNCISSSEASRSEHSMQSMITPGKRALQVEIEGSLHSQEEPYLKKSRTNGGVEFHESGSVEAVEQPRRAQ